ncbi:MAG: multicopper oxidase domain-containing protein [Steroidobacteraceae bacterium]
MDRRQFLQSSGVAALATDLLGASVSLAADRQRPDYTIRIGTALVEVGPQRFLSMTAYNGQFPGPLLRFREGRPAVVDIYNDTDTPEQLHWHGQLVPASVDGAAEERTPFIPPHGMRRERFVPGPSGFRFYHTHLHAGSNLALGQYGGEVGPVYIEPAHDPGGYDREVFLTLKEFEPFFSQGGDMDMDFLSPAAPDPRLKSRGEAAMRASLARGMKKGFEVGYRTFTINGRQLGFGEPVRVKRGERILFHILNGSATEIRSLALPGHRFKIIALDGNPVPHPTAVPVLWLGTAERVSALVEMNHPGVWVLGDLDDDDRGHGMGVIVEYAGVSGKPVWIAPPPFRWDYRRFADSTRAVAPPAETIDYLIDKDNAADHGFNRWLLNGTAFDSASMPVSRRLAHGRRYRLRLRNATDDIHPLHIHRTRFELTGIAGSPTAGLLKDVVMLGGYQSMELDFTADQRGLVLFHCHTQVHMDYGFMALFDTG